MIFTQHYLACLSHASYLVGDETTGRAVVVDPRRDVGVYLDQAATLGLTIERVIETHLHADFLSGHLELAAQTGAVISFGRGADVEFPIEHLEDGQRLSLGDVTLEILATPGHTPESICVVVYEHADDDRPVWRAHRRHALRRRRRAARSAGDHQRRAVGRRPGAPALPLAARQAAARCPTRRASSRPTAPARRVASRSRVRRARRSVSSGKRTMRCSRWTRTSSSRWSPRASRLRPHYFEFDAERNRKVRPLLDEERAAAAHDRRGPRCGAPRGGAARRAASRATSPPGTCAAR